MLLSLVFRLKLGINVTKVLLKVIPENIFCASWNWPCKHFSFSWPSNYCYMDEWMLKS